MTLTREQKNTVIRRFLPFLDVLFLLLLAAYILAGTALTPFHADEATQIHMSRDFAYQFLQGDLARLRYDPAAPLTSETQLRLINGTLGKYLIGVGWWRAGYSENDLNTDWDWGADWDYNVTANHLPSDGVLLASRIPSALLLAAGVAVVFALGKLLGGRPTAYAATLFYALHPGLLINGRRAMMEGSLTFFSLLTVLAGIWFCQSLAAGNRRTIILSTLALGISGGLTIASKHTGAAVVAAVFAACTLWLVVRVAMTWWEKRHAVGTRNGASNGNGAPPFAPSILGLAAATLLVLVVFFALNPAWWGGDPVQIGNTILDWRRELITLQAADHNGYLDFPSQMQGFVRIVFEAAPQYYEVRQWREFPVMSEQIARYESSPWAGVNLGALRAASIALLLLTTGGVFALLRDPDLDDPVRAVVGLWSLAMIGVVFVSPVAWQRYYLPVYPVIGLLAAYAPLGVWRWVQKIRAERAEKARSNA
jgi:hypothetical protein